MITLPPEDQMHALLKLIYFAAIEARSEAWDGEKYSEGETKDRFTKIVQLMDAIHNIPLHFGRYDTWNQKCFEFCLGREDAELTSKLHQVYSQALKNARNSMSM